MLDGSNYCPLDAMVGYHVLAPVIWTPRWKVGQIELDPSVYPLYLFMFVNSGLIDDYNFPCNTRNYFLQNCNNHCTLFYWRYDVTSLEHSWITDILLIKIIYPTPCGFLVMEYLQAWSLRNKAFSINAIFFYCGNDQWDWLKGCPDPLFRSFFVIWSTWI